MIRADLSRMLAGYSRLKTAREDLLEEQRELQRILSRLDAGAFCSAAEALRAAVNRLEGETAKLAMLMQALDTACRFYSACENRISDKCEGSNPTYRRQKPVFADLSDAIRIRELLRR